MGNRSQNRKELIDVETDFRQAFRDKFRITYGTGFRQIIALLDTHREGLTLYGSQVQVLPSEGVLVERHCATAWRDELRALLDGIDAMRYVFGSKGGG